MCMCVHGGYTLTVFGSRERYDYGLRRKCSQRGHGIINAGYFQCIIVYESLCVLVCMSWWVGVCTCMHDCVCVCVVIYAQV